MTSKEFVTSYLDAWNRHDAKSVVEHLSLGGQYYDIPVEPQLSLDSLIEYLDGSFETDKCHYELIGGIFTGHNSIAYQYSETPLDASVEPSMWLGAEFITMKGDRAVKIQEYFQDDEQVEITSKISAVTAQRYAKSGLDDAGLQQVMSSVEHVMQANERFLDCDLSLPLLASELDCSVNHVSQAINAGFGVSFFDYVNQYRVKAAEKLLSYDGASQSAILDVALSVGFNSTSTFYAAFKKSTGQTPAYYRRMRKQNRQLNAKEL